jgi:hypothetical protein
LNRRFILAIVALAVISGGLAVVAAFRAQHVPSLLTIYVTFNWLSRVRDGSYAGQSLISMQLTTTNDTSDNVTLTSTQGFGNQTSEAYWRLQIVLNESTTIVPPWIHDIEKGNDTAGQFGGTVSKSFEGLNGNFTVWVLLWSVYETQSTLISSTSEFIQIY